MKNFWIDLLWWMWDCFSAFVEILLFSFLFGVVGGVSEQSMPFYICILLLAQIRQLKRKVETLESSLQTQDSEVK